MTSVDVVAGVLREADETWSDRHARAVAGRVLDALAEMPADAQVARAAYLAGDWDALEVALGIPQIPDGPAATVDEIRRLDDEEATS